MKGLCIVFTLYFSLAAYWQFNDPDPVRWVLLYIFSTMLCVMYLFNMRIYWSIPLFVFLFCFALFYTRYVVDYNIENEEAREFAGMVICCTWFLILGFIDYKFNKK